MNTISRNQIFKDLLHKPGQGTQSRTVDGQLVVWSIIAVATGILAGFFGISPFPTAPLLTATSILTGLTFSIALKFWDKSIDVRSDPRTALNQNVLSLVDGMKIRLIWTVLVGVTSTLCLVLFSLFLNPECYVSWQRGLAASLVVYQILMVLDSLVEFYRMSYELRS